MKTIKLCFAAVCCLFCGASYSQSSYEIACKNALSEWEAGMSISEQSVASFGLENCFTSQPIGEEVFDRIKGLSYKDNCTVALEELRYLKVLHYNANGQITMGEIVCNKSISDDLLYIFSGLFEAEYRIESVRLVDEYAADDNLSMINNNTSAFNFRNIAGSTQLSKHSLGLAVDINPLYNPYVKSVEDRLIVEPEQAREYVDRDKDFLYKIDTDDLCYKLFAERGFEWGGSWTSLKDYQHFEKAE